MCCIKSNHNKISFTADLIKILPLTRLQLVNLPIQTSRTRISHLSIPSVNLLYTMKWWTKQGGFIVDNCSFIKFHGSLLLVNELWWHVLQWCTYTGEKEVPLNTVKECCYTEWFHMCESGSYFTLVLLTLLDLQIQLKATYEDWRGSKTHKTQVHQELNNLWVSFTF